MKYNVAQIIGLNTDQKAAQVISSNQDPNIFLAVLNLVCDDAFTKGRQFLSEISDFYFESEGSPAEKINATFTEGIQKLKELETKNYDLVIAVISGKILYLISQGQIEVSLKRDNKLSSLSSLGTSSQLISGFLQDRDRVFFATSSLISFLGEDLNKTLELPVNVFEEEILSKIAAANLDQESLAGLILELIDEEVAVSSLPENNGQAVMDQPREETKTAVRGGIKTYVFGKLVPNLTSFFKNIFPKSGRIRLVLGIVLIIIIILGAGLKYKNNQDQQKILAFNATLQKARDNLNNAQGLQTLNPQEAKKSLDLAKVDVNKALDMQPKNQEAQNLKKQIDDSTGYILQISKSNFTVFLDLELVKKSFRANKMSLSAGNILLLDPGTKTLITVSLAKKNNQILAGSQQLGEAESFSLNGGLAFIYSKDKGVLRIDITNQKMVTVAKKDAELGQIPDLYGFAGNIYLLDSTNQKIWKYLPTSEGYSDKREYFSKSTKVDLSDSLRMQIESSIYVLKKGGEILRFTKGDKDNFSLGGLDKGIKDPKSFFISSDTDNLYLLDSGNSRLVVLTKTGQFKSQYQGDKFGTATDLVVDETGKKVYLLEGGKIYSVDLK